MPRRHRAGRQAPLGWLLASAALLGGQGAQAAQTPAGTVITNTARVSYEQDDVKTEIASNGVNVRVDEVIELTVTPAPACTVASTDGTTAVGFLVTNRGNGHEAFIPEKPEVIGDDSFRVEALAADINHNGCYDPGTDPIIPEGGKTPELAPGESIVLFVVGEGWKGSGRILLRVRSATGTGATGVAILGAGDGGSDAVIGSTGGVNGGLPGTPPNPVLPLQASLVKSQSVRAPDGSDRPVYGATITYTIEGQFRGGGVASDVVIADPIPEGTAYVPGSITVDGVAVSDVIDGDSGTFNGVGISVALGDVPAPATHSISFKVKIK